MIPLELAARLGPTPDTFTGFWGVVTAVNAGPPKTVTITVNASTSTYVAHYDALYVPTVGDTVYGRMTMGPHGPDYLVEGKTA